MGIGILQVSFDDNSILSSFASSLNCIWPSSLRAELSAIIIAFRNLPVNSIVHIYTDSLSIASSANVIVSTPYITRILRKKNYLIWSLLKRVVSSLNLTVIWHKVDAHTSDPWNSCIDALSKTRSSHCISVSHQADVSAFAHFSMNGVRSSY